MEVAMVKASTNSTSSKDTMEHAGATWWRMCANCIRGARPQPDRCVAPKPSLESAKIWCPGSYDLYDINKIYWLLIEFSAISRTVQVFTNVVE